MEISTGFEIDAPFEQVWDALLDLERVAPCVPGAEIEERIDDSTARGRFTVRLGPVTARYRGTITIAEADREHGDVVLSGQGTDKGGGTAAMVVRNHVSGANGTTTVRMDADVKLTGRAAQLGGRRSMMQSVADRMVADFAAALRDELTGERAPEPGPVAAGAEADPAQPARSLAAGADARGSAPLDGWALMKGVASEHVPAVALGSALAGFAAGLVVARTRSKR